MFFSNPSFVISKDADLNKSFEDENQGISDQDLQIFKKYADDHNVILLFRPVEPTTKILHEANPYPTKNKAIEPKTSSWGLWKGFIPVNQGLSKLINADTATIQKVNKKVQACIEQKHASTIHLTIPEKYFEYLTERKIIFPKEQQEEDYQMVHCPHPQSDSFEICYVQKVNIPSGIEYAIYTAEKKPFYVLADMKLKRPLIADYDPLAFWEPWCNYGPENKRYNQEITHRERCRKLSPRELRRSVESAERFYAREDPKLGNVAPITIKHINGLNKALDKGENLERIHHNDDAGSPVSKPDANYPITAIIPSLEGFDTTIFLIETTEKFVEFINKINATGYFRVVVNPLWELPVKWAAISNYFFYKVQIAYCKSKSPENMKKTLKEMFNAIDLTDVTLIDELTNLFSLLTQANLDETTLFKKFFEIIQTSLFVNSTLTVTYSRVIENLLDNKVLSEKIIDRLIILNKTLTADVSGFYEILDLINTLPHKNDKIIDAYLQQAERCIYNNKLDRTAFEASIKKFFPEATLTSTASFRP
jgi:hypothetical protein